MTAIRTHLLLALAVLVGSAIPFVPTGEMVSGASAVAAHSELNVAVIFLITWICSVLGDTILLAEARFLARRLPQRLSRSRLHDKIEAARGAVARNAFNAIVTGRLIPGGRTPVIVALGISRYPVRRFVSIDLFACALWAGIYASIGAIGGRIANHPVWAMIIAITFAVSMGALVQQVRRLVNWQRDRRRSGTDLQGETNVSPPASEEPANRG